VDGLSFARSELHPARGRVLERRAFTSRPEEAMPNRRNEPRMRDENAPDAAGGKPDAPEHERHAADEREDGDAVGTMSGLAAGAAIGAVAGGPAGALVGGAAGAIAGLGVARAIEGAIQPDADEAYWRDAHASRPYARADRSYDQFAPAYRYGWESYRHFGPAGWDVAEPSLQRNWAEFRGDSTLDWETARPATRDAWDRVHSRATRLRQEQQTQQEGKQANQQH